MNNSEHNCSPGVILCISRKKLLALQELSHSLRQKHSLPSLAGAALAVALPGGTSIISMFLLALLVTHRCNLQPSMGGFTHFYRPSALFRLKGHIAQRQHTSQDSLHVHLLLKHKRKVTKNLSACNIYNMLERPQKLERCRKRTGSLCEKALDKVWQTQVVWKQYGKSREDRNRTQLQYSSQKEFVCLQEAPDGIKLPQNWPVLGSPPCQGHCTPLGICVSSAELHPVYQIVHLRT